MTSTVHNAGEWRGSPWRYLMWGAAVALAGVAAWAWEAVRQGEYGLIVVAAIFALVCTVVERAVGTSARWAYGAGLAIAVLTGLGQMWMNMAVGLIGSEDNPVNAMFFAVVALALVGGLAARGRPAGMVWAMGAAAAAQAIAGAAGIGILISENAPRPGGMLFLTLYFVGLWLNAAALFRSAAQQRR